MTTTPTATDLSQIERHLLLGMPDDWCDRRTAMRGYTSSGYGVLVHFAHLLSMGAVESRVDLDNKREYRRTAVGKALVSE